jgi:hypothetical protein
LRISASVTQPQPPTPTLRDVTPSCMVCVCACVHAHSRVCVCLCVRIPPPPHLLSPPPPATCAVWEGRDNDFHATGENSQKQNRLSLKALCGKYARQMYIDMDVCVRVPLKPMWKGAKELTLNPKP